MPTRRDLLAAFTAISLAACHGPRPAAVPPRAEPSPAPTASPSLAAAAAPAATPLPEVDRGPVAAWYARNQGRIQLDPNAAAEDLALTLNLLAWVASGDAEAWRKAASRVEAASGRGGRPLKLPVRPVNVEEARHYHAAAAALAQKPEAERDPALEDGWYRKALLLNPSDPDLWNHLAIGASRAKDHAAAERYARTAIAVDPTFLSAYQELSYALKNMERYAEAVEVAARGLNVDGDLHTKAILLARQGQSWWMLGEKDKALGAFASSKRLGGPAWVQSYLDGKQEPGKPFVAEPSPTPSPAETPTPSPAPTPTPPG